MTDSTSHIGLLNERSLHSQVKQWYAKPSDSIEVKIGNYVVDIVRGDLFIEIQTGNFASIREKLDLIIQDNRVRLVYPVSVLKWVVKIDPQTGEILSRRRSPKKGKVLDVFDELLYIPVQMQSDNLEVEVLLIESEDIWINDGKGSWRRKGASLVNRRLVEVRESCLFSSKDDFIKMFPPALESPFTNKMLAGEMGIPTWKAQRITYSLKHMEYIREVGKEGNALLFDYHNL